MESSCHNDLVWNHVHNICDWRFNVDCNRLRVSKPDPEPVEVDNEVAPPFAGDDGECNEGQYQAIPEECSR